MTIELKPEDTLVRVAVFQRTVDTNSGDFTEVPLSGLTGGVVSISRLRDGPALLSEPLVEVGSLGVYTAEFDDVDLALAMAGLPDGALLFRKTQFGTEAPWIEAVIWRTIVYV
jgi:hypothetical protein